MSDHRIESDDARAARVMANLKEGEAVCLECGGTGNEFLFMYRACSQCSGTGIVTAFPAQLTQQGGK
jgi:DnaJ-class molecular chaperone